MKEIVAAIIICDRKVLLVNNRGNWSFPGGTREEGESDTECLEREFHEEFSGTHLKNFRVYKLFSGTSPRNREEINVRAYFAEIDGEFREPDGKDDDVKEARFINGIENYRVAQVASDIFLSLKRDGYF